MNEPRDAQQAWRQAKRTEGAKEIIAAGYSFHRDPDLDTIAVVKPGRLAADYFICDGKCDCPDFTRYQDFCKHTIAAELTDEDAQMDRAAAQDAEARFLSPLPH